MFNFGGGGEGVEYNSGMGGIDVSTTQRWEESVWVRLRRGGGWSRCEYNSGGGVGVSTTLGWEESVEYNSWVGKSVEHNSGVVGAGRA